MTALDAKCSAQLLHDLANALNNVGVSLAVARRLQSSGDDGRMDEFLARAEVACDEARLVMRKLADAVRS